MTSKVILVGTKNGSRFVMFDEIKETALQIETENKLHIFGDENEWESWNKIGDLILHIHLTKISDLLCISPLSANSLAKLANGLTDLLVLYLFS